MQWSQTSLNIPLAKLVISTKPHNFIDWQDPDHSLQTLDLLTYVLLYFWPWVANKFSFFFHLPRCFPNPIWTNQNSKPKLPHIVSKCTFHRIKPHVESTWYSQMLTTIELPWCTRNLGSASQLALAIFSHPLRYLAIYLYMYYLVIIHAYIQPYPYTTKL